MAIAFVTRHPAVTSAIIGPRTVAHLDSYLAADGIGLSSDVLDRIDQIVPPQGPTATSPTTCATLDAQRWTPHPAAGSVTLPAGYAYLSSGFQIDAHPDSALGFAMPTWKP